MGFEALFTRLREAGFKLWADELESQSDSWFVGHGDYARWSDALSMLPEIREIRGRFDQPAITIEGQCEDHRDYCLI